jgi:hypothetical protein
MAAGGLLFGYVLFKLATFSSGSKKAVAAHAADPLHPPIVAFPEPKRDWEQERKEFIDSYVKAHSAGGHSHH